MLIPKNTYHQFMSECERLHIDPCLYYNIDLYIYKRRFLDHQAIVIDFGGQSTLTIELCFINNILRLQTLFRAYKYKCVKQNIKPIKTTLIKCFQIGVEIINNFGTYSHFNNCQDFVTIYLSKFNIKRKDWSDRSIVYGIYLCTGIIWIFRVYRSINNLKVIK